MKRVGLFGGTFDPPHLGHLFMAEAARDQLCLDEVWWIPARKPPHKQGHVLSSRVHRMAMTRHAVAGNPQFRASDIELQRSGLSFTVDTVRAVSAAQPGSVLFLLIGQDNWEQFEAWHRPEKVMEMARLVVFPRRRAVPVGDKDVDPANVDVVESPCIGIASSCIRERVRRGLSVRYLVPEAVCTYIAAMGLYLVT